MKIQKPEITDNYQLRVVVCENQTLEDVLNGVIHALLTIGPLALLRLRSRP